VLLGAEIAGPKTFHVMSIKGLELQELTSWTAGVSNILHENRGSPTVRSARALGNKGHSAAPQGTLLNSFPRRSLRNGTRPQCTIPVGADDNDDAPSRRCTKRFGLTLSQTRRRIFRIVSGDHAPCPDAPTQMPRHIRLETDSRLHAGRGGCGSGDEHWRC
jgi:hypothetical protein